MRASSSRTSSEVTEPSLASDLHPFQREEAALRRGAGRAVATEAARTHDAVARDDEHEPVVGAEAACRARRARVARERGELAVADDLAPRNRAERPSRSRAGKASSSRGLSRSPRVANPRPRRTPGTAGRGRPGPPHARPPCAAVTLRYPRRADVAKPARSRSPPVRRTPLPCRKGGVKPPRGELARLSVALPPRRSSTASNLNSLARTTPSPVHSSPTPQPGTEYCVNRARTSPDSTIAA